MEKRWTTVGPGVVVVAGLTGWIVSFVASAPAKGTSSPFDGRPASITELVFDLAAAATIGLLVFGSVVLDPGRGEFRQAMDAAALSAGAMTVFAGTTGVLVADGAPWLVTAVIGAVVTALCFLVRSTGGAAILFALAVAALWPLAVYAGPGSPGGGSALMLHLTFATIWLGGLIALLALAPRVDAERWAILAGRFQPVAALCFVVVAASGVVEAADRLDAWRNLASAYGALVVASAFLLAAAGIALVLPRFHARRGANPVRPVRAVVAELVLIALAFGVSETLALRRPPVSPVPGAGDTPAEILTGRRLPPPFSVGEAFAAWHLDLPWALASVVAAFLYVAGLRVLGHRGRSWPRARTISWFAGLIIGLWLTSGAPAVYGRYLFSVQLNSQLVWAIVVPALLVLGAPVTLALRTVRPRTDGSRGVLSWTRAIGRSRVLRVLGSPVVAGVVVAVSLWAFGIGPLLRWSTTNSFGHGWAALQLVVAGVLFARSVLRHGQGSSSRREFGRLLTVVAVGIALVGIGTWTSATGGLLLADWFGAMGRTWGLPPLADQQLGGVVYVILAAVVASAMLALHMARRRTAGPARRGRPVA